MPSIFFIGNNNSSAQNSGYYNYYSNNMVAGGTGPFVSSRFGSGIDARRKLNIMQHQHQQFANIQQHTTTPSIPSNSNYYANQAPPPPPIPNTVPSSANTFPARSSSSSVAASQDLIVNPNTNQPPPAPANTAPIGQSSNQTATLASQFASSQILTTRKDFLSYTLSLMRTNSNEHRDSLPTIDISLLKHAAYVFDGIMFYLRSNSFGDQSQVNTDQAAATTAIDYDVEIESNMSLDSGSESDSDSEFLQVSCSKFGDSTNVDAIMEEPYYSYEMTDEPSSETDQPPGN